MLGIRTRGCRVEGKDETTGLWVLLQFLRLDLCSIQSLTGNWTWGSHDQSAFKQRLPANQIVTNRLCVGENSKLQKVTETIFVTFCTSWFRVESVQITQKLEILCSFSLGKATEIKPGKLLRRFLHVKDKTTVKLDFEVVLYCLRPKVKDLGIIWVVLVILSVGTEPSATKTVQPKI